jgi:hypothetical protein
MTKQQILRIAYWSSYGSVGLTSLVNTFALLGYSFYVTDEINKLSDDLKEYKVDMGEAVNFASYYPAMIFGLHFFTSGLSFIPVAGGIAYGGALLIGGTALTLSKIVLHRSLFNIDLGEVEDYADYDDSVNDELTDYENRIDNIYENIFNPAPYFVVGTISILMGVAEIITFLFYRKAKLKSKYPYMEKNISFMPDGILIKLDI